MSGRVRSSAAWSGLFQTKKKWGLEWQEVHMISFVTSIRLAPSGPNNVYAGRFL